MNKMKYSFFKNILLVVAIFLTTNLYSQGFKSGLILGMNGSQISGDAMVGFNKGGLLAGTFAEYQFANPLSNIRMELVYTEKGSRKVINKNGIGPGKWDNYKVSYLEVPVMLNYNIKNILDILDYENENIILNLGLGIGFMVNEKRENFGSVNNEPGFASKIEGSIYLGTEYIINNNFVAFLRYQRSVYNMSTDSATPFWQFWGYTHRGYINVVSSIGIRYYF